MTVECARTSRWFALLLALPALLVLGVGGLFLGIGGSDGVALVIGTLCVLIGLGTASVILRACLTHVTMTATSGELTIDAPAYFRAPVRIPREQINGAYFGTMLLLGSASARHVALVISWPITNLASALIKTRALRRLDLCGLPS